MIISEKQITQICMILIVAYFALMIPYVFVPIMAGMLFASLPED